MRWIPEFKRKMIKKREGWECEMEDLRDTVEMLLKEKEADEIVYENMEERMEIDEAKVSEWKVVAEMAIGKSSA